MKTLKYTFKFLFKILIVFFLFLTLYIILAFSLSKITVNKSLTQDEEIEIFIKTNGVHTDIVVPIKNDIKDWSKEIQFQHTKAKDSLMQYIGIGWGDKGFYLDTPNWSDLKASTAFNAATGLSETAMHTTFYKKINENKSCKKIKVSKENYQKLVDYISNSFQRDVNQNIVWIAGHSYGNNDAFYDAKGRYSLFKTCNSWANTALKVANQRAAFWTAHDGGIFCHYN
jgi:uncharacterized protein (TIGR02117 family)